MRVTTLFLTIVSLFAASLHGQQSAEPWEKAQGPSAGAATEVLLEEVRRAEAGPVRSVPDPLALAAQEASAAAVRTEAMPQAAATPDDGVWDGILLGAAIGAGAGAVIGYSRRTFECKAGCSTAIGTLIGAPAGALVGYFVDSSRE